MTRLIALIAICLAMVASCCGHLSSSALPTDDSPLLPITAPTPEALPILPPEPTLEATPEPVAVDYILNTNTKKFHYPDCPSVDDMKEKNKKAFSGSRDELIALGYEPCKRCNP